MEGSERQEPMEFLSRATKTIKDTGVSVSKSIFTKTKEGLGQIMRSTTVTNIKNKFRELMSPNRGEQDDMDGYPNFSEDQTACTLPPGRRQSMNYGRKKFSQFYYD